MYDTIVQGHIVNIGQRKIYFAEICVTDGKVRSIRELAPPTTNSQQYGFIIPGFIDAHVHIESSMLVPSEFARMAVVHGTVATVSDPHEIANVCGVEGVRYMIENGKTVPFKFYFGAPSCVPATHFETAGATLGITEVEALLQGPDIKYLAEMMNFPGVLLGDPDVMQKIAAAHRLGKPVDGHAPGLRGVDAQRYAKALTPPAGSAAAGGTDHECFTAEEALDKLNAGMKILIREGSAAKNFEALIPLLSEHYENMMFCSDDKHPDSLELGHINQLCARAVAEGIDVFKVLQAACFNPVNHYRLEVGLLQEGDPADFVIVKNLIDFEVAKTYINGQLVAEGGTSLIKAKQAGIINNFNCSQRAKEDFAYPAGPEDMLPVIEALDGQLITNRLSLAPKIENGCFVSDTERDILKIVVVNRYYNSPVAKSFIKNFGLTQGAIASSVAHDSHNIIAVGVDDESICQAVNLVIEHQGGIAAIYENEKKVIALPIAGLMTQEDGYQVAAQYSALDRMVKEKLGSSLSSPFMTLSFMALLVIPHLKLSDKGLFDGDRFELIA